MEKKKLLVSFSGGRTSAYMTKWLLENKRDEYDMVVVFANTGREREETLQFVHDCDVNWGFKTVWIETVMREYGVGASFTVVDFKTANRSGDPFESVIAKFGIPNMVGPFCTRELKRNPINAYVKSLGWKPNKYETAIGFRTDEPKRFENPKKKKAAKLKRHVYPLVDWIPTDKEAINSFFEAQSFNLKLKSHEGNCDLCWKKGDRKLTAIVGMCPSVADWWLKMEKKYENIHLPNRNNEKMIPPYRFYHEKKSVEYYKKLAAELFDKSGVDKEILEQALVNGYNPDQVNPCEESCEVY